MHDRLISPIAKSRQHDMPFGARLVAEGVHFRLWAPDSAHVSVHIRDIDCRMALQRGADGWHDGVVAQAKVGMRFHFVLDDGAAVPDPASRYQPDDVDGESEIIDPAAYRWGDAEWVGRPWADTVLYELHVGTFTAEGTFAAAMGKLDDLVDLGVTAIELLPIADFAGRWNWGYDGALLFAPDGSYGRPEDLKALIDACHQRGLSVLLDVVYNHFGPTGNHMQVYAPLMTDHHETPWGPAVNFDAEGSDTVRDFITNNALYWLTEYHFDGLRFDAVHEIADSRSRHVLQELAETLRAALPDRHVHLVIENAENQAGWLKRHDDGTPWLYDAQWNDDIHHGLHAAITGETHGYYEDFGGRMDLVGRALAEGFAFQGEYIETRDDTKGEDSRFLPAAAFVSFAQNHDQVGNRPYGERLSHLVEPRRARLWAALYLLSPQVPMIFMGEEWGASTPFLFFSDMGEELGGLIRQGRVDELKKYPSKAEHGIPPDPMARDTFERSKLDWRERDEGEHARYLSLYKKLIALRKRHIVPRLAGMTGHSGRYELVGSHVVRVVWTLGDGSELAVVANLSAELFNGINVWGANHLWLEGFASGEGLDGWSLVFTLTNQQA